MLGAIAWSVMLLQACTTGQWVRDGMSTVDVDRDLFQCEREAAQMYPAVVVQQAPPWANTATENTQCTTKGNSVNCKTTTNPPMTSATDANEGRREQAQESCMRARGYRWRENR